MDCCCFPSDLSNPDKAQLVVPVCWLVLSVLSSGLGLSCVCVCGCVCSCVLVCKVSEGLCLCVDRIKDNGSMPVLRLNQFAVFWYQSYTTMEHLSHYDIQLFCLFPSCVCVCGCLHAHVSPCVCVQTSPRGALTPAKSLVLVTGTAISLVNPSLLSPVPSSVDRTPPR